MADAQYLPEMEVDTHGITVNFLRTFVDENIVRLKDMSTSDVCRLIIKPETDEEKISYVELLRRRKRKSSTGKAVRFISHAWECRFLTVVETIFQKSRDEGIDEYACAIWFDIYSVNQHSGIERFDHWAVSFQEAIRKIGKVWIIFIPFFAIWLGRSWCLFELYAMVKAGVPFEILLPRAEEDRFAEYLIGGGKVEDAISKIDIRKAKAFKQSDQDNINALIAKSMGHGRLNELITTEMRKWFVSSAESVLRKMPDDQKLTGDLHLNTVKMYITLGRLADADTELLSRHQKQLALLGAKSIKVAETMCEMGTVKWKLGKLEVALSLLTEARLICGKSELENLDLLGNITNRVGAVLDDQGKYDDAMQSYTESLALKVRCFGTEHASVATSRQNIGIVYHNKGDLTTAKKYYRAAYDIYLTSLGPDHPDTQGLVPFI